MQIVKVTALATLLAGAAMPATSFADPMERVLHGIINAQTGRVWHGHDDDRRWVRPGYYRYVNDDDDDDGYRRGRGWHDDDDDDDDDGRRRGRGDDDDD